jgi:hypothetical protein
MTTRDVSMLSKIRIDLSQGIIEAEGSEEFVKEMYHDFRERLPPRIVHVPPAAKSNAIPPRPRDNSSVSRAGAIKKSKASRTPVIVKDLDLAGKNGRPGLKEFAAQYRPLRGAVEPIGLSVYYLTKLATLKPITIDHVYTSVDRLGVRKPRRLDQAIWDAARRKGWLSAESLDDLQLTIAGENWVQFDLEKADKA